VRASPRTLRRARERALQALFQIEMTGDDWREALEHFWQDRPSARAVRSYATELIAGTIDNMERIDAAISKVADKWALERIGRVERNILRFATHEILFMADVPPKVAINEAVEVAKKFGSEDSGRFVNGILDAIRNTVEQDESVQAEVEENPVGANDSVDDAIEEYREKGLFTEEAQSAIYEAFRSSYDEAREAECIRQKAARARAEGKSVVALIGGLGFAGTGLFILAASSRRVRVSDELRAVVRELATYATEEGFADDLSGSIAELQAVCDQDEVPEPMFEGVLARFRGAVAGLVTDRVEKMLAQQAEAPGSDLGTVANTLASFHNRLIGALESAEKNYKWLAMPIQRISRTSGPKIPLTNRGIFPFDGENAGLDERLWVAVENGMIHATPSRAAIEHADQIVVSMRLFVKRLDDGGVEVEFGPLEQELQAAGPHLAKGIENARAEGRDKPTVNILTTQAAGITRIIGSWLERSMKEATGREYRAGEDFYFNFTPSRVAPGDTWVRTIRNFPQLIGPINRESARKAFEFYSYISVEGCHIFPNPESAEQNKTFENAHDDGNIAMVNACGQLSGLAGTSTFDIVKQINMRPNRQAREPGNGVGGYCYPKDPYFLSYSPTRIYTEPKDRIGRMLQVSVNASLGLFFQTRAVNNFMPYLGAALVLQGLDRAGVPIGDATVTIAGVGYKEGTDDTRMSPSFDNVAALIGWDGNLKRMPDWCRAAAKAAGLGNDVPREIRLYDPFARRWEELRQMAEAVASGDEENAAWKAIYERGIETDGLKALRGANAVLLAVKHEPIRAMIGDLRAVASAMGDGKVIVDGRNMLDDDAIKMWLALGGIYLAIAKGEGYVDVLAEEMQRERQIAQQLLDAVRKTDRKQVAKLLAGARTTVSLADRIQAIHDGDIDRATRLKMLSNLTADNLDFEKWLYLGGKYLAANMTREEMKDLQSEFTSWG